MRAAINATYTIFHTDPVSVVAEDHRIDRAAANIRVGTVVANSRTSGSGPQNAVVNNARSRQIASGLIDPDEILRLDGLSNPSIDPAACPGGDPEIRVLWVRATLATTERSATSRKLFGGSRGLSPLVPACDR
ncbi:hypothetical protein K3177_14840 [Qipengyuania sp. GH25]|uniref:Uncharacterized protein n=1 Tax=Qipengyuania pacifica TaxID=2860199 RepID=A0ABS7JK64_9SPHN|nr:hypothetical protein [Qipengyuania aerophila]MBX7489782.1 hypothetical protein [Qipengyuania aerophila]